MQKSQKIITVIVFILVLGLIVFAVINQSGPSAPKVNLDAFAKCLNQKGVVMYGAYWCPHCQSQKKLFGDAFQYVDYVECDPQGPNANPTECTAQNIQGYPTWIYNGTQYSGEKSLSQLAAIVGFNDTDTSTSTTDTTSPSVPTD